MSNEEPLTPSLMLSRIQSRIADNLSGTFGTLTGTDYIRLIAIVGGYLLLRPYLEKLGAKYQERDHARAIDENEQDSMAATGQKARVIAGEGYDLDEDEDESSDEEAWGRKKRLQQRKERARKKKEIEDRIKAEEDEEDKEIQEFLQD